jgi:hypothetical protein
MDIGTMLAELRAERENLEQAIVTLQTPCRRIWQAPGPSTRRAESNKPKGA